MHCWEFRYIFAFEVNIKLTKQYQTKIYRNIMKAKKKVNYKIYPYRGIFTEIALEQGVSRVAIYNAVNKYHNPRILTIFQEKKNERERHYESVRVD